MESFNYLSVLLSIVLGLAITQVLLGFRGLILTRAKVKLYFPTLIWAGLTLLATLVFSAAKEPALTGHRPRRVNGEFHVIFGLTAIVAAITRREWFHKLLAPALGVLFLLYIALLFARL